MVISAAPRKRFRPDEYLGLIRKVEQAGSDDQFEILGGELAAHATADDPHKQASVAFIPILRDAQRVEVRQNWLVDHPARRVDTFERRNGTLVQTATLGPADTLRCPLFPELGLGISSVFGLA